MLTVEASTDAELKRIKLCYSNPDIDSRESILQWSELLTQAGEIPYEELHKKVLKGKYNATVNGYYTFLNRDHLE